MTRHDGSTEVISPGSLHTRVDTSRARLFVAAGPDRGKALDLDEAPLVVGTDPACDFVLRDPSVSRRHLEVRRDGRFLVVRDLGSTNGTFYGEARLGELMLGFGSEIRAGRTTLRYVPAEEVVPVSPSEAHAFGRLLGRDRKMREIFSLLEDIAPSDATVIIEGETGTGKELVARAIHEHSPRAKGPFGVFDCSAVPKDLIESSLFGHVKGAFTGATQTRAGIFERSNGGTVFLDEIGELDLSMQPKLLRVLEAREVQKVGGDEYVPVDVRVVVATNRNLKAEVRSGNFREDLYYRLAVVKIVMPPLRERRDDIPMLAEAFLESLGADEEARRRLLTDANLRAMAAYEWPGNVRELRNVVERAYHLARGPEVDIREFLHDAEPESGREAFGDLPVASVRGLAAAAAMGTGGKAIAFKDAKQTVVEEFEREYIDDLLRRNGGNISGAAREAGIDRKHFKELMKKYGIEP